MSHQYMLDTNIVSDLIRNPGGLITQHIDKVGSAQVCTSIIVTAELRYGVAKSGSARLAAQVSPIFASLDILPFETPADIRYGELRAALERSGNFVGPNDLLIAAQALTLGLTLVTANEREFSRVPGLKIENWLRRSADGSPSLESS